MSRPGSASWSGGSPTRRGRGLFGTQLGGGTDINRTVAYSQGLITRPRDTIFVLISDLYEGGVRDEMLRRVAAMTATGVQVIVLLALSDDGAPSYDHDNAAALAAMGVPPSPAPPTPSPTSWRPRSSANHSRALSTASAPRDPGRSCVCLLQPARA